MSPSALLRVFAALVVAQAVLGDLPVHCPHHEIKGTWSFAMSKGTQGKDLSCNHKPKESNMCFYGSCYNNKVLGEPSFKTDHKMKVALTDPNVAVATDAAGKKHKGTWTVVYDEGFEVDVAGRKFFAFSKFKNGKSLCKHTWPGWHRDSKNPDKQAWGCYTGQKQSEEIDEDDIKMLNSEELIAVPSTKAYAKPSKESKTRMYQPEHEMVARINAKQSSWKAKVYPQFSKYTLAELQLKAGFKPTRLPLDHRPPRPENLVEIDESDYPANFDWRSKDGQNYVDPVVDQGACGSCYAVSTTSMINSRIRIKTKNRVKPQLHWGQVLSCNRYSQGCAGGFPYLVEKYAQDFGYTKSGKCAKSSEKLKELGESNKDDENTGLNAYIRVKGFGYVGGYYGGTTTAEMMKEIHDNGPIVVGISGGYEMMHYESGIFIETGEGTGKVKNDFEKVDHAVMVVGWGHDTKKKTKYWVIKNSFGSGWGENGYFKIARGGDKYGITSLVTAATPVLGGSDYFTKESSQED